MKSASENIAGKHRFFRLIALPGVIIEREIEPGREASLQHLMMQARSKALKAKGCISG
jgi:hypothetical protein